MPMHPRPSAETRREPRLRCCMISPVREAHELRWPTRVAQRPGTGARLHNGHVNLPRPPPRFSMRQPCKLLSLAVLTAAAVPLHAQLRSKVASAPIVAPAGTVAAPPYTIDQFLSPASPLEVSAARKADRLAWVTYERGLRNVYVASAPAFKPVRITNFMKDDGVDVGSVRLSDDGTMAIFVRGSGQNREGWVANTSHYPEGGERAGWAPRTDGRGACASQLSRARRSVVVRVRPSCRRTAGTL